MRQDTIIKEMLRRLYLKLDREHVHGEPTEGTEWLIEQLHTLNETMHQ